MSYYLDGSTLYTAMHTDGCKQADQDNANSHSSLVVLDFGRADTVSGTIEFKEINTSSIITQTKAATWVNNFSLWYAKCDTGGHYLTVAVTTNNTSLGSLTAKLAGQALARVVNAVQSYLHANSITKAVVVWGGIDAEVAWSSYPSFTKWFTGYKTTTSNNYLDVGAATGCPPNKSTNENCSAGSYTWTQDELYAAAWSNGPAYPAPQIYATLYEKSSTNWSYTPTRYPSCNYTVAEMASQWYSITYSGSAGARLMKPKGPLNTYDLALCTLTPTKSWAAITRYFNGTGMPFVLEMKDMLDST
jgi:hypothetical protein